MTDVPCGYRGSLSAFSKKLHKYKVLRIGSWKALNSLGIAAEEQKTHRGLPALVWPPPLVGLCVTACFERMEVLRED